MAASGPRRSLPVNPYASRPVEAWLDDLRSATGTEARYRAFVAVTELIEPSALLPVILSTLGDDDGDLRAASATWLARGLQQGKIPRQVDAAPQVQSRLLPLLNDSDPDVQLAAARALSWMTPQPASLSSVVLQLLERDDSQATSHAVLAELCGRIRGIEAEAVVHLKRLITAEQADVREAAAGALAVLGNHAGEALHELVAALDDEEPLVRELAATALGQLHPLDESTRKALDQTTRDEDPEVAAAARRSLNPTNH